MRIALKKILTGIRKLRSFDPKAFFSKKNLLSMARGIARWVHKPKNIKYIAAGACIILLISVVGHYRSYTQRVEDYHQLMRDIDERRKKFRGVVGIYIKDMWTGKSVRINPGQLFPSASLVKVPIMAAVFQAAHEGKLNLSDGLVLEQKHKVWAKNGLYHERVGVRFTIEDLVRRMIITSDNTATNVLVDTLTFGYINEKFVEFGLKDTDMRRGIMELSWRKQGIDNYTTANDMAYLLEKIYHKQLISRKASEQMLAILKAQCINDRIPYDLPDSLDIAHKTGSLNDTISDVGIVFTETGDFIICVLTQHGKNWPTAKRFIRDVAAKTYEYY